MTFPHVPDQSEQDMSPGSPIELAEVLCSPQPCIPDLTPCASTNDDENKEKAEDDNLHLLSAIRSWGGVLMAILRLAKVPTGKAKLNS